MSNYNQDNNSDTAFENFYSLSQLFQRQKECFAQYPYSKYSERIAILKLLRKVIVDNRDQIIASINQDFGCRPSFETEALELLPSIASIDYAIKNLSKYMRLRRHKTSIWFWPSQSYVFPVPKGVVGIIVPWNYPLFLTIAPLVSAFAAGNRVMLKLSEHVPATSKLLSDLFTKNFLESKLIVILGDSKIAAEFSALPFDHLLFTGSTEVGKQVMQSASNNLTPVTLELGGKSPAIFVPNDFKQSYVDKIWLGKIMNAGQTCIAPDYIWLPRGNSESLLTSSQLAVSKKSIDYNSTDYCSIINKENYDRLLNLIKLAVEKGAQWRPLANNGKNWHSVEKKGEKNIYKISPGLLLNANHTMEIMQQEIFGPVLPVMEYDTIEQLLSIMQIIPRPLAVYLFTNNKKIQKDFIEKTISGALILNTTIVHAAQEDLPFGGIGQSGMGSYRGKYGFETFSMLKPVYKQFCLDMFYKIYPPIKLWHKKILKFISS
ncbi:MAG: aldehyde dehydrogenase family protein [Gammaproteobacteria bacterium]|nr:aldehyde dehydrogenase family protein [Gammaproteobacteria bacterium]